MAKQVRVPAELPGNDVTGLFSHFGVFSKKTAYHKLVRDEVAGHAAGRWPLLAELHGTDARDGAK